MEAMLRHRKQHCRMHSSYVAKGRTIDIENTVTTAERTPSERMKHTCNTAAMYLMQIGQTIITQTLRFFDSHTDSHPSSWIFKSL